MRKALSFVLLFLPGLIAIAQDVPKGLNINDPAPVFTATDQNGKSVSLSKLLMNGPVVLVFYRGQWCPHCNKQLKKQKPLIQLCLMKD